MNQLTENQPTLNRRELFPLLMIVAFWLWIVRYEFAASWPEDSVVDSLRILGFFALPIIFSIKIVSIATRLGNVIIGTICGVSTISAAYIIIWIFDITSYQQCFERIGDADCFE